MTRRIADETPLCAGRRMIMFVIVAAGKRCGALQLAKKTVPAVDPMRGTRTDLHAIQGESS